MESTRLLVSNGSMSGLALSPTSSHGESLQACLFICEGELIVPSSWGDCENFLIFLNYLSFHDPVPMGHIMVLQLIN